MGCNAQNFFTDFEFMQIGGLLDNFNVTGNAYSMPL